MRRLIGITALVFTLVLAVAGQEASSAPKTEVPSKNNDAPPANIVTPLEVLSDTQGVDLQPYLRNVLTKIRKNWYNLLPPEARKPDLKQGKVSIEFVILPKGTIAAMKITKPSGNIALDRAAWGGIVASVPFAPLPEEFRGPYLALRFHFDYNPSSQATH